MDEKVVELKPSMLSRRIRHGQESSEESFRDVTPDDEDEDDDEETVDARDLSKKTNASRVNDLYSRFHAWFFPGMPEHYPLAKKLLILKASSSFGTLWDFSLIFMSLIACAFYVASLYESTYQAVQIYNLAEIIYTEFFLVDFLFNWFTCANAFKFFTDPLTIVDILTIAPVYIGLIFSSKTNLSIFRFVRILRLIRVLRAFRLLAGLSGVRKQIITLVLTLLSLIFLASGIVQLMENDIFQSLYMSCNYISAETNFEPSCDPHVPTFNSTDCDCQSTYCYASYSVDDLYGQPSGVKCNRRQFFACFYYIIVTVSTVGYGELSPTYDYSRIITIFFIVISMILIPLQVNALAELLAMKTPYRDPYIPEADSAHIILCGNTNERVKLERFAKEFFHPDRSLSQEVIAVVLMPTDPTEELRDLLNVSDLREKLFVIIGSPLNAQDLVSARADSAVAMFFLCNSAVDEETADLEDSLSMLCLLSVNNFNPNLECFVQMVKAGDRDVVKDSNVDVLVCLDELRTILQARNSICHGFSTLIELLFMSFGSVDVDMDPWFQEYVEGAGIEVYSIPLSYNFMSSLDYQWTLMVEGIYLEYGVLLIGVCNLVEQKAIINPSRIDIEAFEDVASFFDHFHTGVVLCDEQSMASAVAAETDDLNVIDRIVKKLVVHEKEFAVRTKEKGIVKDAKSTALHARKTFLVRKQSTFSSSTSSIRPTSANDGLIQTLANLTMDDIIDSVDSILPKARDKSLSALSAMSEEESDKDDDSQVVNNDIVDEPFTGEPPAVGTRKRLDTHSSNSGDDDRNGDGDDDDDDEGEKDDSSSDDELADSLKNNTEKQPSAIEQLLSKVKQASLGDISFMGDIDTENETAAFNQIACEIEDARNIKDHVIVSGCVDNINFFVAELRKAVVTEIEMHPIVVVSEKTPHDWELITEKYDKVYFLRGVMTTSRDFNRSNISSAYSYVVLAERKAKLVEDDNSTEPINIDSDLLFLFLKLERYIPQGVFFSVELISAQNMSVLNATVMKKYQTLAKQLQEAEEAEQKNKEASKIAEGNAFVLPSERKFDDILKYDISKIQMKQYHFMSTRAPNHTFSDIDTPSTIFRNSEYVSIETRTPKESDIDGTKFSKGKPSFWDAMNGHHILPVFASGKAFVPATFDTLLCQSFFSTLTPIICEALVRGQKRQTTFLVPIPEGFYDRSYLDLFRALVSRNVMPLGLYRSSCIEDKAYLPFVMSCPLPTTKLREGDSVYIFGNPAILKSCLATLTMPLLTGQTKVISWFLGGATSPSP